MCAATALKGTEVRDFVVRVVIVTNAAFKAIVADAVLVAVVAAVAVMVVAVVAVMAFVAVAVVAVAIVAVMVVAVVVVMAVEAVAVMAVMAVMAVVLGRGNTITIRLMQVRQNKVKTIALRRRQTITRCQK